MFLVLAAGLGWAQQAAEKTVSASAKPKSAASTSKTSSTKTASSAKSASTGKSPAASAGKKQTASRHRRGGSRKGSWKRKGQQAIQPERARAIQEALIREHYLTGEATGTWDARTQAALVKYQADNGWQSKVTPDSRALIKLGLGPNYSKEQMLNQPNKVDAVASAGASGGGSAGTDK
ncbi:MAG TPA: peptidoglycan-binding domain-containing protein [Terriglobales bacterium]|nr:peptidoglycan-binding domain-containing protein [Terriglobales bacterium]